MSRTIEQSRIDTAFAQNDILEQKRALDREIDDIRNRLGELARKDITTLSQEEKEEIIRARNFICRLDEISSDHRYRDHFLSFSQETRGILQNHFQEIQALHAQTRSELTPQNIV